MTLVQRFFAFLADTAIVLLAMLGLLVLVWQGVIAWSATRDMALFAVMVAYFAVFDGIRGQTPGKRLCRVRLVNAAGNPPGLYQTFLRAGIFFLPPLAFGPVFGLLQLLVYMPDKLASILAGGVSSALLLIWPVSIIAGRGTEGIHDRLAGCQVERCNAPGPQVRAQARVLAMSGLASLIMGFAVEGSVAAVFRRFPNVEIKERQWQDASELLPDPVWYDEKVVGAADYLNLGRESVFLLGSKPTFARSWVPNIPEPLREGTYSVRSFVGYELDVKPVTLRSNNLQLYLAGLLMTRTEDALREELREGMLLECRFVVKARVGMLNAYASNRMTGGWVTSPEGRKYRFLLEPDDSFEFRVSTDWVWRDWRRVSGQDGELRSFVR